MAMTRLRLFALAHPVGRDVTCRRQVVSAHFAVRSVACLRVSYTTHQPGTPNMAQTLEQKIAEAEARLARLRNQSRTLENGQKVILGGLMLNAARTNPKTRKWLLGQIAEHVTREADKTRLAPLVAELEALPGE